MEVRDKFFEVKPYDHYFKTYESLARSSTYQNGKINLYDLVDDNGKLNVEKPFSANAYKSQIYHNNDPLVLGHYLHAAEEYSDYSSSIGNNAESNYFFDTSVNSSIWGLGLQKGVIERDINNNKYNGFNLVIDLKAYASPITDTAYNTALSKRRFKSLAKWVALVVLDADKSPTHLDGVRIDKTNIDNIFKEDGTARFYKNETEEVVIQISGYGEGVDTLNKTLKEFGPMVKNGVFNVK